MDAYVSEIVAVIDEDATTSMNAVVEQLKAAGVDVSRVNDDECVVEGSVESYKLKDLEKITAVKYVRTVFTYAANYPPGDPRDRDGV